MPRRAGYTNVEFRKGDIEKRIPVDENSVDVVISNCVINLTMDKVNAFKEIYRILKHTAGEWSFQTWLPTQKLQQSMQTPRNGVSCIDGALTEEHYH